MLGVGATEASLAVLGALREAVLVEDDARIVLFANEAFASFFLPPGVPGSAMVGIDCAGAARTSAESFADVSAWLESTERTVERKEPVVAELWELAAGGWVERDYIPRFDEFGTFAGHSWVYRDVSDRESLRRQLIDIEARTESATTSDAQSAEAPLTRSALGVALADGDAVLLMANVENYQALQSQCGRHAAEGVVAVVQERLSQAVGNSPVERIGETALAVVCPADAPERLLASVRGEVTPTMIVDGSLLPAQLVLAAVPANSASGTPLVHLERGRIGLREAQKAGRDLVFEEALAAATRTRDEWGLSLLGAIAGDRLHLVYQPIVRLRDGETLGWEALVRWTREDGSVVNAERFVSAAEQLGIVDSLDAWVITRACQGAIQLIGEDADRFVSVNISGHTMASPGRLLNILQPALADSGLSPSRLVLELTETAVGSHDRWGLQAIHDACALGVGIAIDDFGVGSSSLSLLKDVSFQWLKLDKSFASGLDDPRVRTLVSVAASMVSDFGATVIAEGIEHSWQVDAALECGLSVGQGWLLGLPSPARHPA